MSFPRYPAYKSSGVEWLGDVPAHWEVKPLKAVATHNNDVLDETTSPNTEIAYVDISSVDGVNGITAKEAMLFSAAPSRARRRVRHGDVIVSTVRTYLRAIARIREPEDNLVVSTGFAVVRPRDALVPDFLGNVLSASHFVEQVIARSTGVSYPAINASELVAIPIAVPPLAEQTAIAAFLDRETEKMDALVAEQRRLMALLKEKRQAVISHAVTGKDEVRRMKDENGNSSFILQPSSLPKKPSGIEWLGEVPQHWEVRPLKYLMSLTSGGTPSKENLAYWNGTVPWASSKDLKTPELSDTQDHITQKALDDGAAELVPSGSILTVVRGMILLHTFPVVVARVPMAINQDLKAILPTAGVNADFLAWLLRGASAEVLSRTDEAGHGTKVLRLESWLAMQVPVPQPEEQALIVATIIERLAELDTLTAEAQRAIELLQERRTALISAAVTGQIDVLAVKA